jgi:hypothetical protein
VAVPLGLSLPNPSREAVWQFHIVVIAILQDRVNSYARWAEQVCEFLAPPDLGPESHGLEQLGLGGKPSAKGTRHPADTVIEVPSDVYKIEDGFLNPGLREGASWVAGLTSPG